MLTIEVWHQTSGCKGTNFLREEEIGFHLAPADKARKALAAAIDPAGELAADGGIFRVGLDLAEQGGAGEVAGADVEGKGEKCVELMLADRESVGHTASVVESQGVVQMVFEDGNVFLQQLVRLLSGDGHSFIHTGCVAPADGPDACRAFVCVQAASFEGVDEDVCGFRCFHNGGSK